MHAVAGCTEQYHDELRHGSLELFRRFTEFLALERHDDEEIAGVRYPPDLLEYRLCKRCTSVIIKDVIDLPDYRPPDEPSILDRPAARRALDGPWCSCHP